MLNSLHIFSTAISTGMVDLVGFTGWCIWPAWYRTHFWQKACHPLCCKCI